MFGGVRVADQVGTGMSHLSTTPPRDFDTWFQVHGWWFVAGVSLVLMVAIAVLAKTDDEGGE